MEFYKRVRKRLYKTFVIYFFSFYLTLTNSLILSMYRFFHLFYNGLINVYKQIQNNKDILYNLIHKFIKEYDSCPIIKKSEVSRNPLNIKDALKSKENYYYWLRKKFNSLQKNTVEHAALFIVINKTTFRGMYREGPNGFNVPYGHYKTTPTMMTKKTNIIF